MGLFSRFSGEEKRLINQYTNLLSQIFGRSEGKSTAEKLVVDAISKSKEHGGYDLPSNFGDLVLSPEVAPDQMTRAKAERIASTLEAKRGDGVTDDDIKWWWNMQDIERWAMILEDDIFRMAMYISELERVAQRHSFSSEEEFKTKGSKMAAEVVHKNFVNFGDNTDEVKFSGDDRPLPYELKRRINQYNITRSQSDPDGYKDEKDRTSSFNAFIRKEIKSGKL